MRLSELEFGSLLSYTPRGDSPEKKSSKDVMIYLKQDSVLEQHILMSEWVAQAIRRDLNTLPFASFFQPTTILVPTPKSSLMTKDALWVPHRLATALVGTGLGKVVVPCLTRIKPVPKAASSTPEERPTAAQHYESMEVQGRISEPDEIVLVDDIITRGATLLGAANRLVDVFPKAHIYAFAAMRTISNSIDFTKLYDPCKGKITFRPLFGDTLRRP